MTTILITIIIAIISFVIGGLVIGNNYPLYLKFKGKYKSTLEGIDEKYKDILSKLEELKSSIGK